MAVFDLEAVIKLTDQGFKAGLSAAGNAVKSFAKTAGVAVGAGAAGIAALTTSSVKAYAEYEQLAGGVKKLFGTADRDLKKYAQDTGKTMSEARSEWTKLNYAQNEVLRNAEEAYKTTGMSANEYIENVTGISAALVNSYGGDTIKAAQQADKAMRAISDNFNTFGGDIESVKAAYQGFAKQNYTMLDNLKLGYGGTKTEMERLISDANQYREELGLTGDLTIDKYGDIVEAIDLIQQKQGIAGTTAKEAATTISGSLMMTKAAWKNLVRAFSDKDADLGQYFDALVTSAETAFDNILPVAQRALEGIGEVITDIVPKLGAKIPELITSTLPGLVKAGTSLVTSLISGFGAALPVLVGAIPDVIRGIRDGFVEAWPQLKEAGAKLMEMAGEGIKWAGKKLKEVGKKALDKVTPVFAQAFDTIKKKAEERFPGITDLASRTWDSIKSGAVTAWGAITGELGNIWEGLKGWWQGSGGGQLSEAVSNIWEGTKTRWTSMLNFFDQWGGTLGQAFGDIWGAIKGVFSTGLTGLTDVFSIFASAFAGDWRGAWEGVKKLGSDLWTGIGDTLSSAWSGIKGLATVAWEGIKGAVSEKWQSLKEGITPDAISSKVGEAWDSIKSGVAEKWEDIKGAVSEAWENVKSGAAWKSISEKAESAWSAITGTISSAWAGIRGDVITAWGKVKNGPTWTAISEKADSAWSAITGTISGAWEGIQSDVTGWWETVKGSPAWESISENATSAWGTITGTISSGWETIKSNLIEAWEAAKGGPDWDLSGNADASWTSFIGAVSGWVESVKQAIIDTWNRIVGGISFDLPELPTLSITGVINWITGKTPDAPSGHSGTDGKFAKANYQPYMFTNPSFFMAGEAGDEMLYGRTALMSDITDSVAISNGALATQLSAILAELQTYLPSVKRPVVLDSGALVGGIGYDMDGFLGGYSEMGGRGLSLA